MLRLAPTALQGSKTLLAQCLLTTVLLGACGKSDATNFARPEWVGVLDAPAQALMSVHGTSARDVWVVGADAGEGPAVAHYDGATWQQQQTGVEGDLWWVHALSEDSVYFTGSSGLILHYDGQQFERMETPGLGKDIVFGLWAANADDLYAVGTSQGRNGFIWHHDGEAWRNLPLPTDLPLDANSDAPGFFKVWGQSADDVWVVGARGVVLHGNAENGFEQVDSTSEAQLFTVHTSADRVTVVGGSANGLLLDSPTQQPALVPGGPEAAGILQGLWLSESNGDWAVGVGGSVYRRSTPNADWERFSSPVPVQSLHAVWMDPEGGVWSVGGNVLESPLSEGIALHSGADVPSATLPAPDAQEDNTCPAADQNLAADSSIARRWNEQLLAAIRRDLPRPTVHARNLLHTSVALWDAWAVYDASASGYVLQEKLTSDTPAEDRQIALSYAAYRVLSHRYKDAIGNEISQNCFNGLMEVLGLDPNDTVSTGNSATALGNRVGAAVIAAFAEDGANEANGYADPLAFESDTPRLIVDLPGTRATNPTAWQQLEITEAITQNGIAEGSGVREYVGAHWGAVTPFALVRPSAGAPYVEGENPPSQLDESLVNGAVTVLRKAAELDIEDEVRWDISPAARGNNPLGEDTGEGRTVNSVTGMPYAPQLARRGDFARVMAEFWADGPESETPPGHWNALANNVSYTPGFTRSLYGTGPELSPLAWDVHLYLALNGAVHDAAIAAWELKRTHLSARPITLIRYMGGLGQRSTPDGPSYHAEGLPLVDDLIEIVTEQSSAPGQRHAHLSRYVGDVAIWSWQGEPGDRDRDVGGVNWIRAVDWRPYQRSFFVTPAFPGFVSGHSAFSRAAAVVLSELTGSEYFPGGLGSYRFEPGYLFFEYGPSEAIELQWATYYDAADQAGQSRLWGGIHVPVDDFSGRKVGQYVGEQALVRAAEFYPGTASP